MQRIYRKRVSMGGASPAIALEIDPQFPTNGFCIMASDSTPGQESRAIWKLSLYVLWICLVSSLLFAVNTGMVFAFSKGVESKLPNIMGIDQIVQFCLFLLPVVLLYAEWYAWDVLTTRRGR